MNKEGLSKTIPTPKMYFVDVIKSQYADAIIRFLQCPLLYKPEVGIVNVNAKEYDPEYVLPRDCYYARYDKTCMPTKEQIEKDLEKNKYMFTAVGAIDEDDVRQKRISIFACPEVTKTIPGAGERPTLSTHYNDTILINKIIDYIEGIS